MKIQTKARVAAIGAELAIGSVMRNSLIKKYGGEKKVPLKSSLGMLAIMVATGTGTLKMVETHLRNKEEKRRSSFGTLGSEEL